jgi:hypothetical protein
MSVVIAAATVTLAGRKAKLPRVQCPHCEVWVSKNVYSRNHGDKCPYKDAPIGAKKCKSCGEFIPVEHFAIVSVDTFDGRNATCNQCLSKKYYNPKSDVA